MMHYIVDLAPWAVVLAATATLTVLPVALGQLAVRLGGLRCRRCLRVRLCVRDGRGRPVCVECRARLRMMGWYVERDS